MNRTVIPINLRNINLPPLQNRINTNSLYNPNTYIGNISSWWQQSAVENTAFCFSLVSPFLSLSLSHYESWWKKQSRRI